LSQRKKWVDAHKGGRDLFELVVSNGGFAPKEKNEVERGARKRREGTSRQGDTLRGKYAVSGRKRINVQGQHIGKLRLKKKPVGSWRWLKTVDGGPT